MSVSNTKLLLTSLLVNGLLMGFILGDLYNEARRPQFPPGPPRMMLESRNHDMPPELRAKLDDAMQKSFSTKSALHDSISKQRNEAVAILKKEPFDEMAFRKSMDELFMLMGQMGDNMTDTIIGLAKDITPQERAKIAEILVREPGPPNRGGPRFDPREGSKGAHPNFDRFGRPSEESEPEHP
jgi:uncharacterized membrane protein